MPSEVPVSTTLHAYCHYKPPPEYALMYAHFEYAEHLQMANSVYAYKPLYDYKPILQLLKRYCKEYRSPFPG